MASINHTGLGHSIFSSLGKYMVNIYLINMDYLISLLVLLGILFGIVIYQSRGDKFSIQLYMNRFSRLIMTIFTYFKDVGVCAANKFRTINWDLTSTSKATSEEAMPVEEESEEMRRRN
jgi:uncharacterized membrane protein